MDDQLRRAVMGANDIQASPSPLGNSNAPEIANLYRSSYQLPLSEGATAARANSDQASLAAAAAARSSSSGGSRSGSSRASGKYGVQARDDGGYGFYDPNGNEITAAEYAKATGKSLATVLKNSSNPIDKGFLQDFKNLNNYINYKVNSKGNPQAAKQAAAIEQQVNKQYGINLGKLQIQDVTQKFMQAYPTVFGPWNGQAGVPTGQTFIAQPPKSNAKSGNSQNIVQALKNARK